MKKSNLIFALFILFLSAMMLSIPIFLKTNFGDIPIEQIIQNVDISNSSKQVVIETTFEIILIMFIVYPVLISPILFPYARAKTFLRIFWKNKQKIIMELNILSIFKKHIKLYSTIIFILATITFLYSINFMEYLYNSTITSNFFEDNYVDPRNVKITFPDKKRNLIFIHLESMESTFFSKNNGGAWNYSIIPELEKIAKNNISFSQSDKLGGFTVAYGAGWTVAAMVAQSTGIPLKLPLVDGNATINSSSYLPGAYSLGDLLKDGGYNQVIMMGSEAAYGNRDKFYNTHGEYTIMDYTFAKDQKLIDEDYLVWWGYEDKKLYEYAKDEILKLSMQSEPFNFTMLTVDTHFVDGYLDETCDTPFKSQYENVFACASTMVNDFINWIKEQSFYENTTIVITGDHIAMQESFFDNIDSNYNREVYNAFINSAVHTENIKNRGFNSYDIFPTIIASMGIMIEEERLGLGTNLFSSRKTLTEEYSNSLIFEELAYSSPYYNKTILKNTYIDILRVEN